MTNLRELSSYPDCLDNYLQTPRSEQGEEHRRRAFEGHISGRERYYDVREVMGGGSFVYAVDLYYRDTDEYLLSLPRALELLPEYLRRG